jgi:hypothetical protein
MVSSQEHTRIVRGSTMASPIPRLPPRGLEVMQKTT